ncbi:MAG TPA: hypothetical protein V6D33_12230 [Cyanophyceae cyanobacterium]
MQTKTKQPEEKIEPSQKILTELSPGTLVDIYGPYNQPSNEYVWVSGFKIFDPKQTKKSNKKTKRKYSSRQMMNPLTGELEPCYAIQSASSGRVFPVVRSHVRPSSPKDTWVPLGSRKDYRFGTVTLEGYVVADESDKADLAALDFGTETEEEDDEDL